MGGDDESRHIHTIANHGRDGANEQFFMRVDLYCDAGREAMRSL